MSADLTLDRDCIQSDSTLSIPTNNFYIHDWDESMTLKEWVILSTHGGILIDFSKSVKIGHLLVHWDSLFCDTVWVNQRPSNSMPAFSFNSGTEEGEKRRERNNGQQERCKQNGRRHIWSRERQRWLGFEGAHKRFKYCLFITTGHWSYIRNIKLKFPVHYFGVERSITISLPYKNNNLYSLWRFTYCNHSVIVIKKIPCLYMKFTVDAWKAPRSPLNRLNYSLQILHFFILAWSFSRPTLPSKILSFWMCRKRSSGDIAKAGCDWSRQAT